MIEPEFSNKRWTFVEGNDATGLRPSFHVDVVELEIDGMFDPWDRPISLTQWGKHIFDGDLFYWDRFMAGPDGLFYDFFIAND